MSLTNRSLSLKRDKVKIFALIAASGRGSRFCPDLPKQFYLVDGKSPLSRTVGLFLGLDFIDRVVCVIPEGFEAEYLKAIDGFQNNPRLLPYVIGSETRSLSVKNGLLAIKRYSPDYVLIHDAVRCFCFPDIVARVCDKLLSGSKAVVPTISVSDSVRFEGLGIDRSQVELSQTPQGFDYKLIYDLYNKYSDLIFSDDVSLCDSEKITVDTVLGDVSNKKLTFKTDLPSSCDTYKTGFGYDAHRFAEDRDLYLMGILIPNHIGLDGVSDADVGIHSLVDAILGALAKGSIGEHFPEADNKNADSKKFLRYCKDLLDSEKAEIVNIDATIVCESPNISKYSVRMKEVISEILKINEGSINIKGKTTEGMGFEGRREGISATTIVSIRIRK